MQRGRGTMRKLVIILTDTYRIRGEIDVAPDERITDYVTSAKNFVAVTNGEVRTVDGALIFQTEFMNVHRDHIVAVTPEDLTRTHR